MKYRFILFSAILAICHIGTTAEYIIPEGSATASNGTEGFGLLNTLSQDDSSAVDNILANTVDLYSGQYAESFPLASLSGRGGLGYDLVLKYNSNVSHTAKSENYKAQASPFGLGFSIDRHSIIVDHKSTTMLEDDKYRLQSGGGSTELIQAEGNRFITKNGDPWVITRHLDTVDNTPIIIGWTILKEDGTVYQYGDMTDNFTCPVATRLIHHYGTYVGNGVTNDDQPYPYQWDLRKISDPEGLNWIEFYYLTDNAHLRVRDTASGSLVYSGYPYTRGSYLFEILMADSNSVRIIYEDRNDDLQSFYGVNNYEFLYTKRASHVIRLKPRYDTLIRYCDTLYTTKFLYEYLNDENSPSLNKLALKQINTYSKEESEELPPTSFIYHVEKDDCEYGRIHKVCYPFGALKEIFYRAVADSVNVSLLDTALVENQTWNLFKPGGSTLYSNSNMFFHYSNVPVYGCWDGYWHIDTANIDTSKYDVHEWDEPAVSNEDWIAYYDRGEEEIIVKRWMGGYWRTDTLVGSIVRNSGDNVYMSAGTDCFVVAVGPYGQAANTPSEWTRFLHRAYYYYWNGNYWVQYQIFDPSGVDPDTYKLSAVKVNVNTYGIYCWDYKYYSAGSDNNHYRDTVIFGKYNYSTDSIASYSQPWGWCGGYDGGRVRMVVGPDMVAFTHSAYTIYDNPYIYYIIHSYNTVAYRWVDDNWSFTVFSWYDEDPDMKTRRLALLSNGFINAFLGQSEFISVFRDGDSFKTISNPGNGSYSRMWTSGHSLIIEGAGADHEIRIYEWDGIDWDYDHLFNWYFGSGEPVRDVQLFQNSYAYGPGVTLRRYMGNQTWEEDSIAEFVAENNPYDWQGCRASSFYLARRAEYGLDPGDDTNYVYLYNKYYDDNYKRSVLNAPTWEQGGSNNSSGFYPHEEFLYQVDMFNYTGYYKNDIYGYRYFDRQFKGKPLYVIVDSIVLLNFEEDENPTIQKFNFFAGMLASDGLTPRFAKAEVSTPYTANDDGPDGYTKFYFYNDIDSAGFYDAAVYDSSLTDSMYFPDMDNGTMYRVANGGYHLDGRIYYTESYSVDSEQTANFPTYTYNYYSLHNVPDSELVIDVYRIHLDSTKLEKGNFYFWTNYEYDTYSGQITRKRSSHFPASTYMVEDYVYAHADSTGDNLLTARAMLADNAINRIKIDSTYYDSLGTCRLLSKSGRNYDLNGGWESVQHYSWRDLNDQTEILVTDSAYAFDDFGNLLGRINANGVVSASKYDNRGLKIIGEASNCRPEEFLVQDFEQIPLDYTAGSGWDGWHLWNDEYGNGHLDTTDAFTGKACFTIKNDDASDQINENNWGPGRTIMASELTSDLYYFSGWVKANEDIFVYCWCACDYGDSVALCTLGYKYKRFQVADLSADNWQKIEGVFDLSDLDVGAYPFEQITLQLVQEDNGTDTSKFAKFDNFRFHPIDAHVSTTVYNDSSGLMSAELGLDNIPTHYKYDKLHRLTGVFDYTEEMISQKEYRSPFDYPLTVDIDTLSGWVAARHGMMDPGETLKEFVIPFDQTIEYKLCVLGYAVNFTSCCSSSDRENYAKIGTKENGVIQWIDYVKATQNPDVHFDTSSGSLQFSAGDTVCVAVKSTNCWSSCPSEPNHDSASAIVSYRYLNDTYGKYVKDSLSLEMTYPEEGSQSTYMILNCDMLIHYDLSVRTYHSPQSVTFSTDALVKISSDLDHDSTVISVHTTGSNGVSATDSGSFIGFAGDTASIFIQLYSDEPEPYWDTLGYAKSQITYYTFDTLYVPPYVVNYPYSEKTTDYNADGSEVESATFYDGFGRPMQTRSTNYSGGNQATLVSNVVEYDARGRINKAYKPYYDLMTPTGIENYSIPDSVLVEVNEYYDDDPAADCDSFPYVEYLYESKYRGRLVEKGLPGNDWKVGSENTTTYQYRSASWDGILGIKTTSWDPDSNLVVTVDDYYNMRNKQVVYFKDSSGTADNRETIWYNNVRGELERVTVGHDLGGDPATTRQFWYNDLGQKVKLWRVDYDTARMIYDRTGNLRFMQNEKHAAEHQFVYYKYDKLNRKIEEGLCTTHLVDIADDTLLLFSQRFADDPTFPRDLYREEDNLPETYPEITSVDSFSTMAYKWVYDYTDFDLPVHYGRQVWVQDKDADYSREFHYFPFEYKDSTVVDLLMVNDDKKSIVHEYDSLSGRIEKLIVYPYEDTTGARAQQYLYDLSGRLSVVRETGLKDTLNYRRDYATYSYFADGQYDNVVIGKFEGDTSSHAQIVNYAYNPIGMLTSINDTGSVVNEGIGSGDHFGMNLSNCHDDTCFYNGRIAWISSASSDGIDTFLIRNEYYYDYNALGWLTKAIDTLDSDNNRLYTYNYLGNRTSTKRGLLIPDRYYYNDENSGSSLLDSIRRLVDDSVMFYYDEVGNTVSIPERPVTDQTYDYRNMLMFSALDETYSGALRNKLNFDYNENGMRIRLAYDYYWREWDPGAGGIIDPLGHSGYKNWLGLTGLTCMGDDDGHWDHFAQFPERHYLYDGNVLLAIFSGGDDILQSYVNSSDGPVAVYHQNEDDQRYYFIKDHIGNTRVMVDDSGSVKQYINYHPFGDTQEHWSSYSEPMRFTGKERDHYGSFYYYYFGARYYDPALGQFSTTDPRMDDLPSYGPYVYALDNPLSFVDPDGEFVIGGLIVAAVVAAILFNPRTANAPAPGEATITDSEALYQLKDMAIIGGVLYAGGVLTGAFESSVATEATIAGADVTASQRTNNPTNGSNKSSASESSKREGIYEVETNGNKKYVGQSSDMNRRLKDHVYDKKISKDATSKARLTEVKGGKTAREIAEQKKINELGGIDNLANKRNPIGPKRQDLLKPKD